jgi:hypothetical protein
MTSPDPHLDTPRFDVPRMLAAWDRLHAGHWIEPPAPGPMADAWVLYHNGAFEQAAAQALKQGHDGLALANHAITIHANYLEPREAMRLALFKQVAERASAQAAAEPDNCEALYWFAYALDHYSQGISAARALARGLGPRIKNALEFVIERQPRHADAHITLAVFHAEVIDKVGPLVGRMTYGVQEETALSLFKRGLELNPYSARGLMEYARGLLMLHGDSCLAEATRLHEQAAAIQPADARERLDVELARAQLLD